MAKTKPIKMHEVTLEKFRPTDAQNHQYKQLSDRVHMRYRKTVVFAIAAKRLHPADHSQTLDIILKSREENYNPETKIWTFDYSTDVIETYSLEETAFFENMNEALLSSGKLIVYEGSAQSPMVIKPAGDEELERIMQLPTQEFITSINSITEPTTLRRLSMLLTDDYPVSKHKALSARMSSIIQ